MTLFFKKFTDEIEWIQQRFQTPHLPHDTGLRPAKQAHTVGLKMSAVDSDLHLLIGQSWRNFRKP
jgi:hypothetical protein